MWLELLTLILGIVFGVFHPGKEDYKVLLRNGAITGIVAGIIFLLISRFLVPGGMSIDLGFLGMAGFFIAIVLFVVLFIMGAFIGDQLERVLRK